MPAPAAICVNNPSPALEMSETSTYTLVKEESTKIKNESYLLLFLCMVIFMGQVVLGGIYLRSNHKKVN